EEVHPDLSSALSLGYPPSYPTALHPIGPGALTFRGPRRFSPSTPRSSTAARRCGRSSVGKAASARTSSREPSTPPRDAAVAPSSRSIAPRFPPGSSSRSSSATKRARSPGAHRRKPGQFEYAHKGTIYLDEIAELPLALQAKPLH